MATRRSIPEHEETPKQRSERLTRERDAKIEACPVKKTDLTGLSCGPKDPRRTYVTLEWDWDTRVEWLIFGAVQSFSHRDNDPGLWTLEGTIDNVSDFEHDTCRCVRLPLIGVSYRHTFHGSSLFQGWVQPGLDAHDHSNGFHVPRPGYDPRKHKDSEECDGQYDGKKHFCKWGHKHLIVPQGFYVPPFDPELYALVAGKKVEVRMFTKIDDEE